MKKSSESQWRVPPKDCPHCGGNEEMDSLDIVNEECNMFAVECNCGVRGPFASNSYNALVLWNLLPRKNDAR